MVSDKALKEAVKNWKNEKVTLVATFINALNCSLSAVKCLFKSMGAISSFNMNGKYYTLPNIAEFDKNGLWFCNSIGFSKNGNLNKTIIYLVNTSAAGMSSDEIFKVLHLNSYSVLAKLFSNSHVHRENLSGKYIYFSTNKNISASQKKEREKIIEKQFGREISDTVAVAILTELISNPALGSNEFIKHLGKKSINITEVQLKSFLEHHGILKKTRDLPL